MNFLGLLDRRDSIKGLTKIQKDYVCCLLFISQLGDLILEGEKITKAGLDEPIHVDYA